MICAAVVAPLVVAAPAGKPGDFKRAPASPEDVGANVPGNTSWGPRVTAAQLDDQPGMDLAVVDSTSSIAVLSGEGDGDFTEIGTEATDANPIEITAADFDGINGNDLAVASDGASLTILLNDGTGEFTEPGTSPEPGPGGGITSADFDGDEDIDLVVGSVDNPGQGAVLLNDGSGDFAAGDTFQSVANELVQSADLDDDEDIDAVALAGAGESAALYFNDGDGNLTAGDFAGGTDGTDARGVAVGRIGPGPSPDVALASVAGLYVFLNDGDGGFTPAPQSPLRRGRRFVGVNISDFDRDGRGDVIAGESRDDGREQVGVFLSGRGGRLKEPRTSPERLASGGYGPFLASGPFDDRKGRDIAASLEGALTILLNRSP